MSNKDTKKSKKPVVKVAGCWEFGVHVPYTESFLWHHPLGEFGVEQLYMSPITGLQEPAVTEVAGIQEVIELNPDLTVVWVDEKAESTLSEFKHPKNALYILGKSGYSPMLGLRKKGDRTVRIDSGAGSMYAHQAIVIVLYDRFNKEKGLTWQ